MDGSDMSELAKFAAILETMADNETAEYVSPDGGKTEVELRDLLEFVVGRDGKAGFLTGDYVGLSSDCAVIMTIVSSNRALRSSYICGEIQKLIALKGANWYKP